MSRLGYFEPIEEEDNRTEYEILLDIIKNKLFSIKKFLKRIFKRKKA
jgi:hypothetical protein